MDAPLDRMVSATGLSLPLAAQIVGLILDSGASQSEVAAALEMARLALNLLPLRLVAETVGPPEIHR